MRKITCLNIGTYNFMTYQLERMGINIADIKSEGMSYSFFDEKGRVVAELDEDNGRGVIYDYQHAV